MNGTPHLVQDQRLLPWRHAGYGAAVDRPRGIDVEVLTPKLSVATLRAGFKPRLHATATNPKIRHSGEIFPRVVPNILCLPPNSVI